MFRPGDCVFVDRQATAQTAFERMAEDSRSKLLLNTLRPFRIFDKTSHLTTINENSKKNVISTDQAAPAPPLIRAPPVEQSTPSQQNDKAPKVEQLIQDVRRDTSIPN